jgi:hypothetical protein
MFFSGAFGTQHWATNSMSNAWLTSLAAAGYEVVQVSWATPGWESASSGEDAGQAHVACRPATVIRWVHDNLFQSLGAPGGGVGVCGFCVTGNSGGASQISYALAYYGLAPILNGVFPSSGPPHAALAKGCLNQAGFEYGPYALQIIDSSNGYVGASGPCAKHDPSFTTRWNQESVDTNGTSYYYPTTRLHFIFGGQDTQSAKTHAGDYLARLSGTPMIAQETVASMAHEIEASPLGMAALLATIQAGATVTTPSPPPPPSPSPAQSPPPGASPPPGVGAVPGHTKPPGGLSSPPPNAKQSPAPGNPQLPGGRSPIRNIGDVGSTVAGAVIGSDASRNWIWVVILGLSLVAIATALIPRIPLLRRGFATVTTSLRGRRPKS